MTRAPYVLSKTAQAVRAATCELFDTSLGWRFVNPKMKEKYGTDSMGQTAENVAEQYGCQRGRTRTRSRCGRSRRPPPRAAAGRFAREIVPVDDPAEEGRAGRGLRAGRVHPPGHDPRDAGKLKPAFRTDGKGSVTAGNSSGLNDGACALLIASETGVQRARPHAAGAHRRDRRSRASSRGSWEWVRCPRRGRCWPRPGSRSTRWTSSSSTRRSRRRRSLPARARPRRRRSAGQSERRRHRARAIRSACRARGCCSPRRTSSRRRQGALRALHDVHRRGAGHGDDHRAGVGASVPE